MRPFLPVLFCCAGLNTLQAQTLTGELNNPLPGDAYPRWSDSGIPPGPSGMDVTWDYSALVMGAPSVQSFLDPSGSAYGSYFPDATVRTAADAFLMGDATGLYYLGFGSSAEVVVYNNTRKRMGFPCSYQSGWTDTYEGLGIHGSAQYGTTTAVADGVGTLVLPYGSIPDVLRVRVESVGVNVTFGTDTTDEHLVSYQYYKPGVRVPLLQNLELGGYYDIQWLNEAGLGVAELLTHAIGVDVFPNPATDAVDVVYGANGARLLLDLIDVAGAVVQHMELGPTSGIGKQRLELAGVAPGLYAVRITDGSGGQGLRRLVVH